MVLQTFEYPVKKSSPILTTKADRIASLGFHPQKRIIEYKQVS
jgi:hypothetical protein